MGEFDDLIDEFVTESKEHIADIEEDLIRIETDRENVDPEVINRVFRAAHSIKGSAKFLDLTNIGDLAHKMEDVLNLIRAGKLVVTSDVASTLLHGADMLKSMFEDVTASNTMDISENLDQLQRILEDGAKAKPAAPTAQPAVSQSSETGPLEMHIELIRQKLAQGQVYRIKASRPDLAEDLGGLGEIIGSTKNAAGQTEIIFASIMEADVLPMAARIDKEDIASLTLDMLPDLAEKSAAPVPKPQAKRAFRPLPGKEPDIMEEESVTEGAEVPARTVEVPPREADLHRDNTSFITFSLDNEIYAVPIYMVEEIIGLQDISLLPNVPGFIKGVINLRGDIVPVLDLRLKFGLENKAYNPLTVFLIVRVGERVLGMVVDKVSDVLVIQPAQIQPTPAFSAKISTDFIDGVYKDPQGQLVIIINIAALIKAEEWSTNRKTSPSLASVAG